MATLGDDLPVQMARVRDQVMPAYREIGAPGAIALAFMRQDLDKAAQAMAEGDVAAMIAAHKALAEYKL